MKSLIYAGTRLLHVFNLVDLDSETIEKTMTLEDAVSDLGDEPVAQARVRLAAKRDELKAEYTEPAENGKKKK